jgi:S-DNA-T family DNA segregation ATPase FtsK/SpoIIIE
MLAGSALSSISEARQAGCPLPHLLLLLDGWENFVAACDEHDTGRSVDVLYSLLRESASAGLTVAIAGDRATLSARVSGAIARKFILRLADPADFALAGISARSVPATMPSGRAIRANDGQEVQFAFLGADPSNAAQWAALASAAAAHPAAVAPTHPGAVAPTHPGAVAPIIRIRALPRRIQLAQILAQIEVAAPVPRGHIVLGVGGDGAEPIAVDLFAGDGRWLIAGPRRSGRTSMLVNTLVQFMDQSGGISTVGKAGVDCDTHCEIVVAAPRRSPLFDVAQSLGIAVILPDGNPEVPAASGRALLALIDDSEHFLDTVAGEVLCRLAQTAGERATAILVSGRSDELALTYRGIAADIRRSHTGILLQPSSGDGELFGLRLPRTRPVTLAGRGVLIAEQPQLADLARGAQTIAVQLALPEVSPCAGNGNR